LTEAKLRGKGSANPPGVKRLTGKELSVVKEKWGTKRTCPKCATRFYDLGKENPVVCIDCGNEWVPEPILKSRQPHLDEIKKQVEEAEKITKVEKGKDKATEECIEVPEQNGEGNPDNDLDLDDGGDVANVVAGTKNPDESA